MIRDLGQLQAFLAIIQHGSVGRAADALCVTQSALTRIIQRLEEQVGVPLFERHTRGMTLTSYGTVLEPYAAHLVAESANAMGEMAAMRGLKKGLVRVGSVASALETILPQAIDRLLVQWPGLQISVSEGITEELAIMLAKNEIDLAVAFLLPETEDLALVSESGWQEGCHIVAASGHPLHARQGLDLADVITEKWVLPPKKLGPREEWQRVFLANGLVPPQPAVETRSVSVMRSLVARCGFLSWLPDALISAAGTAEAIRPLMIGCAHVPRHFAIYRRRHGILSAPAVKLVEELRHAVKSLATGAAPDSGSE
ncbi:LysR family transcriptional regulator [Massilia niastensis]|uniref:LysR family transcriptional regulator n=1 Tax=Massilia niastensis TaxID=544911 RepID=UPI000367669F|nr:LysR family transcriptional regulator [Massilia niastensis]